MTLAFKEWAQIVDALGKGKQSIVIRKGGISEEEGDFIVKGKKFLLFPTLFHQAEEKIKPQWLPFLKGDNFHSSDNKVTIRYFAEVADSKLIKDWETIHKLDNWHAWKEEVMKEKFTRWENGAHLMVLQVFELPTPIELELLPEYGGCKSWIEIDQDINLVGKPVINKTII